MSKRKKCFWSDDEKREICTQAATVAQVARRYARPLSHHHRGDYVRRILEIAQNVSPAARQHS
jgi:transposase-like protein